MKNRLQKIGAIAAITFFSSVAVVERANAETHFYAGSQLLSLCEPSNTYETNACNTWLMGLNDTLSTMKSWGYYDSVCTPLDVYAGQLRKVIIKYFNEHPEELHLAASGLAINALYDAFPCE